tara:strand:+ start:5155 stop:5784 length:630 start_codon:yes stop_codon:yes gene_type:complete
MAPESSALKKGARVIVIDDLPGVTAGTAGRVGRAIGIKTVRYRVQFENGINALSVAESKLVSPAAWEFIKEQQIAPPQAVPNTPSAPAVPVAAAPASAPTPDAPTTAPETSATTPQQSSPASSASGSEDPRLAALTAKSREARKAAGVDVDAEVPDEPPSADVQEAQSEEPITVPAEEPAPAEPTFELPDGYFPTDNRVAELLASIKDS